MVQMSCQKHLFQCKRMIEVSQKVELLPNFPKPYHSATSNYYLPGFKTDRNQSVVTKTIKGITCNNIKRCKYNNKMKQQLPRS